MKSLNLTFLRLSVTCSGKFPQKKTHYSKKVVTYCCLQNQRNTLKFFPGKILDEKFESDIFQNYPLFIAILFRKLRDCSRKICLKNLLFKKSRNLLLFSKLGKCFSKENNVIKSLTGSLLFSFHKKKILKENMLKNVLQSKN